MKKYLFVLLFGIFCACSSDDPALPPPPGGGATDDDESTAYKGIAEHFGVNLSGAEFAQVYPGIDGTNYGYPTAQCLDYFKGKGLTLIRFPFRWERVQRELNGELYAPDINKMKAFVAAAEARDMPIILDMHNFARRSMDGGDTFTVIGAGPGLTTAHLADVWMKLVQEFKGYSNIWAYDIMNEPYDMPSASTWFDIAQAVIYKIRAVDTETPIIISGDSYSSASRWLQVSDHLKNLKDPSNKLIYQAHTYFDRDASGQYQNTYETDGAHPQIGVERVKPFVEWLKKNNKVGIVGEYGIPDDDERWNTVLENMLVYLRDNGVPGTYWSAGPRWGDYKLAVQPTDNYTVDRPQMAVLEKYTETKVVE